MSERAQIADYFETAESIAQRMADVGSSFETLMDAQTDPLSWSEDAKAQLADRAAALEALRDEAASMTVPHAFSGAHPLLVRSIDDMVGAVDIVQTIASDPSMATYDKANEMTAKAAEGESLAGEYVSELERILNGKYPEMMAEGGEVAQ